MAFPYAHDLSKISFTCISRKDGKRCGLVFKDLGDFWNHLRDSHGFVNYKGGEI